MTLPVDTSASDADGNQITREVYEDSNLLASSTTVGGFQSFTLNFAPGTHTLTLKAHDSFGNEATQQTRAFVVNPNQPPTLDWLVANDFPVPNGNYTSNFVTINFSASDADNQYNITNVLTDNGTVRWSVNGGGNIITPLMVFGQGSHTVTVTSTDPQGNASTLTRTFTMLNNMVPSATIAPSSGSAWMTGDTINIDVVATDSDGTVSNLKVLRDNVSLYDGIATAYNGAWIAAGVSNHVIKAIVTDNNGTSITNTSTISVSQAKVYLTWTVVGPGVSTSNGGKTLTFGPTANNTTYAYCSIASLPIGSSMHLLVPSGWGELMFGTTFRFDNLVKGIRIADLVTWRQVWDSTVGCLIDQS